MKKGLEEKTLDVKGTFYSIISSKSLSLNSVYSKYHQL